MVLIAYKIGLVNVTNDKESISPTDTDVADSLYRHLEEYEDARLACGRDSFPWNKDYTN